MSKRKVIRVKAHDIKTIIPGIGSATSNDLPPTNKTVKMEMFEGPYGIEVHVAGQGQVTVLPYANVQVYFTESEPSETKKSK